MLRFTRTLPVMLGANIEGHSIARTCRVASFYLGETSGATTRLRPELRDYGAAGEWTRMIQSQFRECERTRIRIPALARLPRRSPAKAGAHAHAPAEFFDH